MAAVATGTCPCEQLPLPPQLCAFVTPRRKSGAKTSQTFMWMLGPVEVRVCARARGRLRGEGDGSGLEVGQEARGVPTQRTQRPGEDSLVPMRSVRSCVAVDRHGSCDRSPQRLGRAPEIVIVVLRGCSRLWFLLSEAIKMD